jgi:serine/threonine protein phosphatase PrpC
MITDEQIRATLSQASVDDAVRELVRLANEHGGEDNVTVVVIAVEP